MRTSATSSNGRSAATTLMNSRRPQAAPALLAGPCWRGLRQLARLTQRADGCRCSTGPGYEVKELWRRI